MFEAPALTCHNALLQKLAKTRLMSRRSSYRRPLIALLTLGVLLSPFQMVFACEGMDGMEGMVQYECCCDEPCTMGMAFERDVALGERSPLGFEGCCDVSYLDAPDATARGSHCLVVMLDASQPPPIPSSFEFQSLALESRIILSGPDAGLRLPTRPVYLLTNRFRI